MATGQAVQAEAGPETVWQVTHGDCRRPLIDRFDSPRSRRSMLLLLLSSEASVRVCIYICVTMWQCVLRLVVSSCLLPVLCTWRQSTNCQF